MRDIKELPLVHERISFVVGGLTIHYQANLPDILILYGQTGKIACLQYQIFSASHLAISGKGGA
jgi:hypothetical protein